MSKWVILYQIIIVYFLEKWQKLRRGGVGNLLLGNKKWFLGSQKSTFRGWEIYFLGMRNLLLGDEKSMVRPSTLTVRLSTLTMGASTFSLRLWEIILKTSGKTVNVSGVTVTDSEIYSAFAYKLPLRKNIKIGPESPIEFHSKYSSWLQQHNIK